MAVDILFERGPVYVLNKPSGLLTQAPQGIDSLEWQLKSYLKSRENPSGNIYLGLPHRLDRPVSGAIVFARNVRAAQRISQQIEKRTVIKTYWTMVEGTMDEDEGVWIDWMRKLPDEPRSEIVDEDHPEAKQAILRFRVLNRCAEKTLLEIALETGRTHQIRLQCAARQRPIVGDQLYGSTCEFGLPTPDLRKQPIALHARRLAFEHPIDHEPVDVTAPLPDTWKTFDLQIFNEHNHE